ncbi:hypothetical protein Tco_1283475 [Tanacetum coccineum]
MRSSLGSGSSVSKFSRIGLALFRLLCSLIIDFMADMCPSICSFVRGGVPSRSSLTVYDPPPLGLVHSVYKSRDDLYLDCLGSRYTLGTSLLNSWNSDVATPVRIPSDPFGCEVRPERVDMGSRAETSSSSKRDMGSYSSTMKASDVKALTHKYKIPRDLHPVAVSSEWTMDRLDNDCIGLYEQYFEFAGLRAGRALTDQDVIPQHTTSPLNSDETIPGKTDSQQRVETSDPKIVATRIRKAQAAAKRKTKNRGSEGTRVYILLEIPAHDSANTTTHPCEEHHDEHSGVLGTGDGDFDDDVDEEVDLEGPERHPNDTTERVVLGAEPVPPPVTRPDNGKSIAQEETPIPDPLLRGVGAVELVFFTSALFVLDLGMESICWCRVTTPDGVSLILMDLTLPLLVLQEESIFWITTCFGIEHEELRLRGSILFGLVEDFTVVQNFFQHFISLRGIGKTPRGAMPHVLRTFLAIVSSLRKDWLNGLPKPYRPFGSPNTLIRVSSNIEKRRLEVHSLTVKKWIGKLAQKTLNVYVIGFLGDRSFRENVVLRTQTLLLPKGRKIDADKETSFPLCGESLSEAFYFKQSSLCFLSTMLFRWVGTRAYFRIASRGEKCGFPTQALRGYLLEIPAQDSANTPQPLIDMMEGRGRGILTILRNGLFSELSRSPRCGVFQQVVVPVGRLGLHYTPPIFVSTWGIHQRSRRSDHSKEECPAHALRQFESLYDSHHALKEDLEMTRSHLVRSREDFTVVQNFFNTLSERHRKLREEHAPCSENLAIAQAERDSLMATSAEQALRIKELEQQLKSADEAHSSVVKDLESQLAQKDSALVYAERVSSDRLSENEELRTQLAFAKREKIDAVKKLLPTVVGRLLQSHEYKQSLSVPFNYALQTGWGQGLAEARSEEELREIMMRMNGFDAYSDKKMNAEYERLFSKTYSYVDRISHLSEKSVQDLLKLHPAPPPKDAPKAGWGW